MLWSWKFAVLDSWYDSGICKVFSAYTFLSLDRAIVLWFSNSPVWKWCFPSDFWCHYQLIAPSALLYLAQNCWEQCCRHRKLGNFSHSLLRRSTTQVKEAALCSPTWAWRTEYVARSSDTLLRAQNPTRTNHQPFHWYGLAGNSTVLQLKSPQLTFKYIHLVRGHAWALRTKPDEVYLTCSTTWPQPPCSCRLLDTWSEACEGCLQFSDTLIFQHNINCSVKMTNNQDIYMITVFPKLSIIPFNEYRACSRFSKVDIFRLEHSCPSKALFVALQGHGRFQLKSLFLFGLSQEKFWFSTWLIPLSSNS